jgi:hypothetical protein
MDDLRGKRWGHDIWRTFMFLKKLSDILSSVSSLQHAYLSSSDKGKRE